MSKSLFQCTASVPIPVVSLLRVGAPSSLNRMLLSHPDISLSTALLLFCMLVLEILAVLYLVCGIFIGDNTCSPK